MEPQLPQPRPSGEMGPVSKGREIAPSLPNVEKKPLPTPEQQPAQETREVKTQSSGGDASSKAPQAPVAPPMPPAPAAQKAKPSTSAKDTPHTAGDDDVIEKEWVEKAKQIVAETRHDPYLQEQEVSRLQADYLKKRYGKEVKLSTE